jgi:hypothetical protein
MTEAQRLRDALVQVRNSLQYANDTPNSGIDDTLWMMHSPNTVFDYIDSVLDVMPSSKEEKAVEFVENFIKHGFRIDKTPTRKWSANIDERSGQAEEYQWWSHYVGGAEKMLKAEARAILEK